MLRVTRCAFETRSGFARTRRRVSDLKLPDTLSLAAPDLVLGLRTASRVSSVTIVATSKLWNTICTLRVANVLILEAGFAG